MALNPAPLAFETKSQQGRYRDLVPALEVALGKTDVTKLPGWKAIRAAFPHSAFDGMTIYLTALVPGEGGAGYVAPADIALLLAEQGGEGFEESVPGRVLFKEVDGGLEVTDVEADLELSSDV